MPRISQREQYQRRQQLTLIKLMFAAGTLLFLLSGFFWFEKVYGNSNNTFWAMVDSNLKSYGQGQYSAQSDESQSVSQEQAILLQLGSQAVGVAETNISQSPNTPDEVTIDTETISTTTTNYVRYTDIEVGQKLPDGRTPDFSQAENVWAKEPNIANGRSVLVNAMFGALGRMPVADLQPKHRQELVKTMQDNSVYTINQNSVKMEYRGIRPVYIYEVTVNVQQYVFMLKEFDKMSGLNQIQGVDPTQFPEKEKVKLKVTVDILSRNMLRVEYLNNKQTETLRGFGAYRPVAVPEQAVSLDELDAKLQGILSGQQ